MTTEDMKPINEIYEIVNGIEYTRDVPDNAKRIAEQYEIIIIVGGSDDLMYCYGADCYLTNEEELSCGWDGEDLSKSSDECLKVESTQLGLKIFWCGKIESTGESIPNYNIEKNGAFSYSVNKNIDAKDFTVFEDDKKDEVYCTGKIIKLPDNFISCHRSDSK